MKILPTTSTTNIEPLFQEAPLTAPGILDDQPAPQQSAPPDLLSFRLEAQLKKAGLKSLPVPPETSLKQPKADALSKLNDMLNAVRGGVDSGKEEDRLAVDKVLKKTVETFAIGQHGVASLEFDPKFTDQGGTIGLVGQPKTSIVIGKSALNSAEELASTILHESSHVFRNRQLADAGIDRSQLGFKAAQIYSDLIEAEGCHVEIKNAKKLGTSESYVKGAQNLQKTHLDDLEAIAGKDWRELAEKGQFDKLHEKFRQAQLKTK